MTDTARSAPSPALPTPAATPHEAPRPPAAAARARGRLALLVALGLVVLVAGGLVAYRWWYDSRHYVSTDNAQIAGRLIQIGGLAAGRVTAVRHDVGDRIGRDDIVATIQVPVAVGATSGGVPRLEYRDTSDSLIDVRSPVSGLVVARGANPSDTVPAGQTLLTVVDPRELWVNANIEETQVRRLRVGQRVAIHVDVLNRALPGRVVAITPASAATFSLLPSQNASGNFTRVTQVVPVRIAFETPPPDLLLGTSVSVRIETEAGD